VIFFCCNINKNYKPLNKHKKGDINMYVQNSRLRRLAYGALSMVMATAALLPIAEPFASAAALTSRSIQMSSSAPSATGVTYNITFTAPSAAQSVVIDFCGESPLAGDNCTSGNLAGFSAASATSAGSATSGTAFTSGTFAKSAQQVKYTALGTATTAGATQTITLSNMTNPTATGSFYARIYTYTSGTPAWTAATTPGAYADFGGVAMSTAAVINVTAKVMETLAFCVYAATCGDDPSILIGHTSGTTKVIDASVVDTADVKFSLSSNAQNGISVRWKGDTLKAGTNQLAPVNGTAAALVAGSGTAQFGMGISNGNKGTGITVPAAYVGGASTGIATLVNLVTANVTSTYGDPIATTTGPVNASITTTTWNATAANTTQAGIYTAAEQFIATGTF
jgi:hypothetical protein